MKITVELLKEMRACSNQVVRFSELYPDGLELPSRGKRRAEILEQACRQGLDVVWWLEKSKQSGVDQGWYENGKQKYRKEYKNGERHGVCEGWYDNGQQWYRDEYRNGKRHGVCEGGYPNGQQRYREEYRSGKRHGVREDWYPNGQQWCRAECRRDKLHGVCEWWDDNGQQLSRKEYENGVFVRDLMEEQK